MNNNFSLGNRLRNLRKERALTQEQVALTADITPAYLGQVERGVKNVTVNTLEKICGALSISLAEFFNPAQSKPNNGIDEISNQILHQLTGRTTAEKQALLSMIKQIFHFRDLN